MRRETWASRIGFVLAAVGSAVGLGNVWRFPFQVGQNGGSAFLFTYLVCVLVIGIPAILVEFVVGRSTSRNPIGAFTELGTPNFRFVGAIGVITGFVILSYYTVVGGWVLRYLGGSATGAYFGASGAYFDRIAMGLDALALHALFMLATAAVVALGIRRGIELAVKVMVPAIVTLLVGLAVYAFTLQGSASGYGYYLTPDLGYIAANWASVVPAAVGQALFTLSLGMGVMITYSSYLGGEGGLLADTLSIAALDTFIAFLAGLVVFPFLFTLDPGADPGEGGAGTLFVNVAGAFAEIPFGEVVGVVFFAALAVAALSSSISILEVAVSYLVDTFETDRRVATAAVAGLAFLAGVPAALDLSTLNVYDVVTGQLLLPLGMFLLVLYVSWVVPGRAIQELRQEASGGESVPRAWLWTVRSVVTVGVFVTLVLGTIEVAVTLGLLGASPL
jgi:NSS family neurotransmitter:Na+ symporter